MTIFTQKNNIWLTTDINEFKETLFSQIEEKLLQSEVQNISRNASSVGYSGPPFRFIWNGMNLFNGIYSLTVSLIATEKEVYIQSKLRFYELLIISALFTVIPAVVFFYNQILAGEIFALVWGVFYFGTIAVSSVRYKKYITKTIKTIIKETKLSALG